MQATDPRCFPDPEMKSGEKAYLASAAEMMRYLDTIQELPTLSSVAMRANSMLLSMDTTARDLAGVIEKDQAMVGKLLKLANSSFFGVSSRVSDVAHAVMILGFNAVLNAILSMAVIDAFSIEKGRHNGLDATAFWRHSIGVAVTARYLSRGLGGKRNENVFTAGILHDIGKVVMALFFTDRFIELQQAEKTGQATGYLEAEKRYFPLGHAAVGAILARCWNLPEDLTAVIARHHHPGMMPSVNNLVELVHTADALMNLHIEQKGPPEEWPICSYARKLMGGQIRSVDQWLPDIEEEIEEACQSILDD